MDYAPLNTAIRHSGYPRCVILFHERIMQHRALVKQLRRVLFLTGNLTI